MSNPFAEDPIEAPTTNEPILVEINARMVPLILRALERYTFRKAWVSDEDYQIGLQQINQLRGALLTGTTQIVEAIDRLYRLVDTSFNGTQYAVGPQGAVEPAIPTTPPAGTGEPNAMRAHLGRLHQLAENLSNGRPYVAGSGITGSPALTAAMSLQARLEAVQGEINAGWFGIGGQPATVADIVAALRIGSPQDTTRITDAIEAIAGDSLLAQSSQAANIFGTISNLVTDTADVGAEGAVLGTLIAASIATSGMLGVLAGQLDRLVAALDGGGLVAAQPAPAGSVIGELTVIKEQLQ